MCQRVYSHRQQVLDLVASPTSTQQFLSAHIGDDGASGCTLWNMQDLHSAVVMTLTSPLEALATFPDALAGNCSFRLSPLLHRACLLLLFSCAFPQPTIAIQLISSARTKISYTAREIQSCNEECAHVRPRRCGCAAWGRRIRTSVMPLTPSPPAPCHRRPHSSRSRRMRAYTP